MQLSMWMFVDRLEALAPKAFIQKGGCVLRNARLLADSQEHARTTLYLQYNNSHTIMCMNGNDIFVVNSDDINQVLNDILDVFDRMNEWSDAADELIRNGCTLDELLAHATMEARMHLLVADATYYIHSYSAWGEPLERLSAMPLLKNRSMDIDSILKVDAMPQVRSADVGTYYVSIPAYNTKSPVGNIFVDGVHQGWVIGMRADNRFTAGDLDTLSIILHKVEAWMEFNNVSQAHHEQAGVLARLLEGKDVSTKEIQHAFDVFAWRGGDHFCVIAARRTSQDKDTRFVAKRFLQELSGNSFVVPLEGMFAIVINESLGLPENYYLRMEEVCDLCGYAAGKSPTFCDIGTLQSQYSAACVAARFAQTGEVVGFEAVQLDYALELIKEYAVSDVRHGALDALAAYDAAHKTQLLFTLQTFVRNKGSFVDTYSQLFIHRSTLAYRLERIAEIGQLDLSDEKTWNHLVLSFLLPANDG